MSPNTNSNLYLKPYQPLPVLVYAFGVQRDSVITVKFNEAVDFSSIFDVVNWEVKVRGK